MSGRERPACAFASANDQPPACRVVPMVRGRFAILESKIGSEVGFSSLRRSFLGHNQHLTNVEIVDAAHRAGVNLDRRCSALSRSACD
eukprot:scaffold150769_cov41-Prasinocladus_malaysianus.AAC.2